VSLFVIARSNLSAVAQRAKAEATKQSILSLRLDGLRRRFAPRNDDEILFWLFEN
jgi:hypothetical protein